MMVPYSVPTADPEHHERLLRKDPTLKQVTVINLPGALLKGPPAIYPRYCALALGTLALSQS